MTQERPRRSSENRTFWTEGRLMLALPAGLLAIALVAAMVLPRVLHDRQPADLLPKAAAPAAPQPPASQASS